MTPISNHNLERFCWFLFADLNTRFTVLIEECKHLQDIAFELIDEPIAIDNLLRNLDNQQKDNRPWIVNLHEGPISCVYYSLSERSRSLVNLWNSVGRLALALTENQKAHRMSFESVIRSESTSQLILADFWRFSSQRGYLVDKALRFYIAQIEHSQESLAHYNLIPPAYSRAANFTRSWNSALYDEFLGSYSDRVYWETGALLGRLTNDNDSELESLDFQQRANLTLTWAQAPMFRSHRIGTNTGAHGRNQWLFGSIHLARFWLEQPTSLPLLYHQYAHLAIRATEKINKTNKADSYNFLTARLELTDLLRTVSSLEYSHDFWEELTGEFWADIVSVALCGKSYILSLILQLFGQSGSDSFRHFDDFDLASLEAFGTRIQDRLDLPMPELERHRFWEARILIALWVSDEMFRDTSCHNESSLQILIDSARIAIDCWFSGGISVYTEQENSNELSGQWTYRKNLNEWVFNTTKRCLVPVLDQLRQSLPLSAAMKVSSKKLRDCIADSVASSSCELLSSVKRTKSSFSLPEDTRLEDIAHYVRWYMSYSIIYELKWLPRGGKEAEETILRFAKYARHDGGNAIRPGLEWWLARNRLLDYVANRVVVQGEDEESDDSKFGHIELEAAIRYDISRFKHSLSAGDRNHICQDMSLALKWRHVFNVSSTMAGVIQNFVCKAVEQTQSKKHSTRAAV